MLKAIRSESAFLIGAISSLIVYSFGQDWLTVEHQPVVLGVVFLWIFGVMLWCAFAAVRHADSLAELLGEPYGTLILTISVIAIEVAIISAVMLNGKADPTLARDTMLAVVIIVLNGMVGLALLLGGLRHGEQEYNLQGARAFLGVLVTLSTISLILPNFTLSMEDGSLSTLQSILFSVITVLPLRHLPRHPDDTAPRLLPAAGTRRQRREQQWERRRRRERRPSPRTALDPVSRGDADPHPGADRAALQETRHTDRLRHRGDRPADSARRRAGRDPGSRARGPCRTSCRHGRSPAAIGQHLPRLGPRDDQPDRARRW